MPSVVAICIIIDTVSPGGILPPLSNMITEIGAIEIISEAGVDIVTE
jgi:hypothetical protein